MRKNKNYNGLTDREIKVLAYRYYEGMSLQAVGRSMTNQIQGQGPISRERVRQIEAAGLRKIRKKPEEVW